VENPVLIGLKKDCVRQVTQKKRIVRIDIKLNQKGAGATDIFSRTAADIARFSLTGKSGGQSKFDERGTRFRLLISSFFRM
jgi:hypothetical protein